MTADTPSHAYDHDQSITLVLFAPEAYRHTPGLEFLLPPDRTGRIRFLNDRLRTQGRGGMIRLTSGIISLGLAKIEQVFQTLIAFEDFTPDNDPYGEHDFGLLRVAGESVFWKVDYYDRSQTCLSPDPADPKVTVRVLTVMLAEEY